MADSKKAAAAAAEATDGQGKKRLDQDPTVVRFMFIDKSPTENGVNCQAGIMLKGGAGLGLDALARCSVSTFNGVHPKRGPYAIVIWRLNDAVQQ